MSRWTIALGPLLLWFALTPLCQAGQYTAPLMRAAPVIDGTQSPGEWDDAIAVDGFTWQDVLERRRASGYFGATAEALYVCLRTQLPEGGAILAAVDRPSENLVFDDAAEIWLDPAPDAGRGRRLQMLANSLGHAWYKAHAYGGEPDDPGWRGDWNLANSVADGYWTLEVEIPLTSVAPGRVVTEGAWGLNLCRDWKQDWGWSCLGGNEYKPTERVRFVDGAAPVASLQQRGDPFTGQVDYAIALRNPGPQALQAAVTLRLDRDLMPTLNEAQTVTLAPGEVRAIALRTTDLSTRKFTLTATAASPDGATTYLDRALTWSAAPAWTWTVAKREIPPLDFRFAYYPYLNRMRILADATNLPAGAQLETLTARIRPVGGEPLKTVTFDDLRDGRQELAFDLPPLNGQYEIALQATGPGVPESEVVKPFERTVYEWEHAGLGTTSVVYPPFTPIEVTDGRDVSTVLRRHRMSPQGLWESVSAAGQELLDLPMAYLSTVDGQDGGAATGGVQFAQTAGNQATGYADLRFGEVNARANLTWDYDGTMRVDLDLQPGPHTINSLDLEIPLKRAQSTHLHAMGDGIRNTLYQEVPIQEGVVWDARKVACNDLPRNFCSYLYLGTPVRGLSWFAENDRDWGWDPATPNLEIENRGSTRILRIHLINTPTPMDRPRRLTFGLLAAPVKPRLCADWRHKYRRDRYSLLGTDINWLALGDCGSVYPAGKDMELWHAIRQGNRENVTDEFINQIIERGTPYFAPYGQDRVNTFIGHARYNLRARLGTRMVFYYNRASYQLADEFETFKDEWGLTDWRSVEKGNGIGEIKIVPSDSYIDHALYWYGKSFEEGGNQGVYWDNWFFVGDYNTQTTGAYTRPDGQVIPSTGIWGLRELCKRTFQYMNELGMPPITMPHMTSTQILPLHSFATVQYDWEWKYSEGDVQDRFTRDYILLVTNGELAGTWPVLLNDHGPQAEDPWVSRTFAAVCMLHELDCPYAPWSATGQAQLALFKPVDDILARPGVQAYRYWDERPQPVTSADPDLPTIVYVVPGEEAVFAVVSYARQDEDATLTLDAAALGMPGGVTVTDAETGEALPLQDGQLRFTLKKHDIRLCRVVPR